MGRIGRGWKLAKIAFGVVRADSALLTLSVLGGLAALFVALAFLIPAAVLYDREQTAVAVVLLVAGAYLATFLGVYFGVALAAAAAKVLDGQDATVADGLAAARTRLGPIAGWALFALTVNLVIAFIRERAGVAGDVVAGIAGVAWGLVTFLVIPVIALEGLGPWAAVKRSGSLFRTRWGEQITGNFAIGAIFLLAGLVPAFVLGAIGWVSDNDAVAIPLFVIAVVLAVAAIILARTVGSVFAVALYRFAATGAATGPFSEEDLRGSVRARPAALGQGV
jgi:Family of unknown function (DUF6159)